MGSKWKLRWSNDFNQDKNDFDGSTPTSEKPKISFSCAFHRKRNHYILYNIVVLIILYIYVVLPLWQAFVITSL